MTNDKSVACGALASSFQQNKPACSWILDTRSCTVTLELLGQLAIQAVMYVFALTIESVLHSSSIDHHKKMNTKNILAAGYGQHPIRANTVSLPISKMTWTNDYQANAHRFFFYFTSEGIELTQQ